MVSDSASTMTAAMKILRRPRAPRKFGTQRRARVLRDSLADLAFPLRFSLGLSDIRRTVLRTRVREALCTAVFLATSVKDTGHSTILDLNVKRQ